jgi:leucyl-tRNA synthetase
LEKRGHTVAAPQLPGSESPNIREQVAYVKKHFKLDANTVLLGHSLGAVAALKVAESLPKPIAKLVLAGGFTKPKFEDHPRPFEKTFDWEFNFKKIKRNAPDIRILHDINDKIVSLARARELHTALGVEPILFEAESMHICGKREPAVLENCVDSIKVFTTRPDTLFGATYVVLAPEHKLIQNLKVKIQNWREVERYISKAKAKSEEERIAEGREKTGVELRGVKAINPATKKEIPVWVADYVLSGYGTGAIMAVPAHDERDWEFAKKYKLPIRRVIQPVYIQTTEPGTAAEIPGGGGAYAGEGVLVNSGKFNGMDSEKAKWEIAKSVGGERRVQYRLRDWLISRQRYWGPPIPIIYCRKCWEIQNSKLQAPNKFKTQNFKARAAIIDGKEYIIHPVPEKDLPVKLPYVKDFRPRGTGKSPLASVKSFYEARCPQCGGKARRETDVSDTFLDSAWYFLRYPSAREKKRPWNPEITKKWLPVHSYIGGAEHAVLHLLYSRFLAMAMKDAGRLRFEEPFSRFRTHGLITKDGAKMSKSRGNVVNPDEYFSRYGADAMRMYLAFLAPLTQGGDFRDEGIAGITRFLERVWRFGERMSAPGRPRESGKEILAALNRTIKKVGEDIEDLRYNTAISALMVLLSEMEAAPEKVSPGNWRDFCKLLAPFAPFLSEELWHAAGGSGSVHLEKWPVYNPKLFRAESVTIAVQVNGKVRDTLEAGVGASEEEVKRAALRSERVRKFLGGAEPKRIIYVPGRLINLVI